MNKVMNPTESQPMVWRRVVRWYDRRTRSWVVEVKDADGLNVEEAEFCLTEKEAIRTQFFHRAALLAFGRTTLEKLPARYA